MTPSWPSPALPDAGRSASCGSRATRSARWRRPCAGARSSRAWRPTWLFATPGGSPSTRGWRCTFQARTATPAKMCWSCKPMAGRWCCNCCWRAAWRPAAARSASRSLSGAFSAGIHGLCDALIALRTLVEASLDFPEEETDFLHQADARGQLSRLRQALGAVLQQARQGALLRDGIEVVIAGQPNAGKSSLLNALAGAELAIVTPVAGTTRDKVQQTIQIEGVPLHIIDTAGLRASDDEVERIGIARSWEAMAAADAVLFLHDLARAQTPKYIADDAEIERALARKLPPGVAVIDVWNKLDCVAAPTAPTAPTESAAAPPASARPAPSPRPTVHLSARTGQGLDGLRRILLEVAGWQSVPEGICIARARHVQALQMAAAHLEQAADQLQARGSALELLAEELRLAQNALDSITGAFTSDDLLGAIFARFCIGK